MSDLSAKYQYNDCGCTMVRGCLLHTDEGRLRLAALTHVPDPEMDRIAEEATEMQVLAAASMEEGWRVNKSQEQWFAERPCPACLGGAAMPRCGCDCHTHFATDCTECDSSGCMHKPVPCTMCAGGFVRAGKP